MNGRSPTENENRRLPSGAVLSEIGEYRSVLPAHEAKYVLAPAPASFSVPTTVVPKRYADVPVTRS